MLLSRGHIKTDITKTDLTKTDLAKTDLNFVFEILINIFLANHPNVDAGIPPHDVEGKK